MVPGIHFFLLNSGGFSTRFLPNWVSLFVVFFFKFETVQSLMFVTLNLCVGVSKKSSCSFFPVVFGLLSPKKTLRLSPISKESAMGAPALTFEH